MISFGGLATGLDTNALIQALVDIERSRASSLEEQQSASRQKQAVVRDISSAVDELSTLAEDLDSPDELRSLTASSNNELVKVTGGSDAMAGIYDLSVTNLARAETSRSFAFGADEAGVLGGGGTLDITVGGDDAVSVSYDDSMSLSDLAGAINASDARVTASVLFDGSQHRLQVTAQESGVANAITFADSAGLTGLSDAGAEVVAAEDAEFVLAGTTVTRSSNVIDDAIAGVTLELLAENVTDAQINVAVDQEGVQEKMQGYVDALNKLTGQLQRQLNLSGDSAPAGSLFGDRTLRMLQRDLSSVVGDTYGSGGDLRLADFGIEVDQAGNFEFDVDKFTEATAAGTSSLEDLFSGDTGLQAALVTMAEGYTDSIDGFLTVKDDTFADLIDRLDERITRIDDGALELQDRLTLQYANLEQLVSDLNAQGSQLLSILGTA